MREPTRKGRKIAALSSKDLSAWYFSLRRLETTEVCSKWIATAH